jgi:hypothetical protein
MSLSFRQEMIKVTYEKIALGLIVLLAGIFASNLIEKSKNITTENFKDIDIVVNKTEEYFDLIHEYSFELEELNNIQAKYHISLYLACKEDPELKSQISIMEKKVKKSEDKLFQQLKTSSYNLGAEIQNHLITYLAQYSLLYSVKEDLRSAQRDKRDWQIENSLEMIENTQDKLKKLRLNRFNIRDFAIGKAIP